MSSARISPTLSRHFSPSFIASGRSSGATSRNPHIAAVLYVLPGRPAFARPYVGVHWSTSLMSSSLLLQQCLVRLTWIVFVMGGRWAGCRIGALWGVAAWTYSILLAKFLSNCRLASSPAVLLASKSVHPYSSIDTTAAWKKLRFILSVRFDFHIIDTIAYR